MSAPNDNLLPLAAVLAKVGLKKSRLYEMVKEGTFPEQALVGGAALWSENEINDWIQRQLQRRPATLAESRAEALR